MSCLTHFVIRHSNLAVVFYFFFLCDGSVWRHYHWKLFKWTFFLDGEWVYPWEHKHHTHVGPQSHRMHTRREGISSCLRFEAALPELPVLLNPILKEHFTPHVCEAPGIGRECTHKATYTNTICMPDAMCNHRRKRRHFGSWNSITVCLISETVLSLTKCSL